MSNEDCWRVWTMSGKKAKEESVMREVKMTEVLYMHV
jgi:hypothetical protein